MITQMAIDCVSARLTRLYHSYGTWLRVRKASGGNRYIYGQVSFEMNKTYSYIKRPIRFKTQSQLPLIWLYHSHMWTVCCSWVQSGGQKCGSTDMTRCHVVPCTSELPLINICFKCQQGLRKSLFEFIYRVWWHSYEYITYINVKWL